MNENSTTGPSRPLAVVFACKGLSLCARETAFFREANPWGFILFSRNVKDKAQLSALCAALRETVGRFAPVFVDQEGGRVARLKPPHWRGWQPVSAMLDTLEGQGAQEEALFLRYRLIAHELRAVGITANCAPVLDIRFAQTHPVLADRTLGREAGTVARLGGIVCKALLDGAVLPVIKHAPGHGRATEDSHAVLPSIDTDAETLENVDFAPFRALSACPAMMSAHMRYMTLDARHSATCSRTVVETVIRGAIAYDGLLMSDDLAMKALDGPMGARAAAAFAAGCDVVLHCTGLMEDMMDIAAHAPTLSGRAARRAGRAEAAIGTPLLFDEHAADTRLEALGAQAAR